jgi:AcrR family transcriptional regulator
MPPKVKITKEDIVNTALELVRINGKDAINARAIASSLNCSTQPVFSNFTSMEELQKSVFIAAYNCYLGFIDREVESNKYPKYKAFGMAYVRFAKEERELFKFLFMCDRTNKDISPSPDFEASVEMIMKANGLSKEKATLMHFEMWSVVHGIGTMLATSFLSLEWELISEMISDVYHGIRLRHASEEK